MRLRILQPVLPFLALPLLSACALGQATGVAHPDQLDDSIATTQGDHYVKPSHRSAPELPAPVVQASPQDAPTQQAAQTSDEPQSFPATGSAPARTAASCPSPQPTPALIERTQTTASSTNYESHQPVQTASLKLAGADDGVVSSVPNVPHQLNSGVVLKARLDQTLSTENSTVGSAFSAALLADVGHDGEVLLPAGSVVRGRITAVRGSKIVGSAASIRLQPEAVTLPDGTHYALHATVSDLDGFDGARVTDEGAIQARVNPKVAGGAAGLTTTTGAVTGAMIGGGVGAAVGATVGAGVGAYWWIKGNRQETLPQGTTIYFSLDEPLQLNPR